MKLQAGLILLVYFSMAHAQVPLSTSIQLQELVATSKQELKSVKELLEYGQRDADALERSLRLLQKMSDGLDQTIDQYRGTTTYEKALLKLQAEETQGTRASQQKFATFQAQSIQANLSALNDQQNLSAALQTAKQGFVPKLQTLAQLGNWQTGTRISSQLTELLSEIRDLSAKDRNGGALSELVEGADMQNSKQREVSTHGLR